MPPSRISPCAPTEIVSPTERRAHQRYPVELSSHYKVVWRNRVLLEGACITGNLSKSGVFFRNGAVLEIYASVEKFVHLDVVIVVGFSRLFTVILFGKKPRGSQDEARQPKLPVE